MVLSRGGKNGSCAPSLTGQPLYPSKLHSEFMKHVDLCFYSDKKNIIDLKSANKTDDTEDLWKNPT